MGGYIKVDKDLEDDPRVMALAHVLAEFITPPGMAPTPVMTGIARNSIVGGLYRLWRYADTHIDSYDRIKVRYTSLTDVTLLPLQVLRQFPGEWLKENEDGTVTLPGYSDKNALLNKEARREQTRKRVRRWRLKHRNGGNALPKRETNEGYRHKRVTTGTGTETPQTGTETGRVAAPPPPVATGGAAHEKSEPEGPLPPLDDTTLRRQVELLRTLHWDDVRILAKWARRGMTEAHLAKAMPA